MNRKAPKLVVAGGGTGGHVLAGVAIADTWRERIGKDAKILFVGAKGGIEERLVPRSGYPLRLLRVGTLKGAGPVKLIRTLIQIPLALLASAGILFRFRPDVVIGVGGYASGPLVLMARLIGFFWGGKTAILEQNAVPGLTNRILGRAAHRVFAAFPGLEKTFSAAKLKVTGNPIRSVMKPQPSASRNPFVIFVFGGSQGAVGINTLIIEAIPHLSDVMEKIRMIHQTGEKDFDRVDRAHREAKTGARVEKFIYEMPRAYEEASLLICRAGSSTLSEIAAVRRAAILVPFPFASDNHQEKNARILESAGAAKVLLQQNATGKDLADQIRTLIKNPDELTRMEKAVSQFYRPDAAKDVVENLLS